MADGNANDNSTVVTEGLDRSDVRNYLDAIAVDEVITGTLNITTQVNLSDTYYQGTQDFMYKYQNRSVTPTSLVFAQIDANDVSLIPYANISFGISNNDYAVNLFINAVFLIDRVTVIGANQFLTSSMPITIYVLKNKNVKR